MNAYAKIIAVIEEILNKKQKVILIANGDDRTREELKVILSKKGYSVLTAKDKEEAILRVKEEFCHCILINLHLPRINGLAVLKEAKKIYPDVCVIVMSDYELPETLKEATKLYAYAYIKKTVDVDELVKLLKEANL